MNKTLKIVIGLTLALALVIGVGAFKASAEGMGDTGSGVSYIQSSLISLGYSIPAGATGFYGAQTQAAVSAFQAAYASEVLAPLGLTAPTGFAGTLTKAKIAALLAGGSYPAGCTSSAGFSTTTGMPCSSTTTSTTYPAGCTSSVGYSPTTGVKCDSTTTTTTTTTTTSLAGTDGNIASVSNLSQYNNEEVGDGTTGVKVLGMEVEASTDGDIALKSMKLNFDSTGNTGSTNLDDYVKTVNVWMGSTKIGTADVKDFSDAATDGIFTKTITFDTPVVVKSNTKVKFYISVDANTNFDSGDLTGDSWTVDVDNIRFVDGSGVVSTDTQSNGQNVGINFVDFATSANTELKVALNASTNPEAGIVIIDDTSNTNDVVLLQGKLTLDGTSDVTLKSFPVTLTAVTATNIDAVTGSVTLVINGNEYSESTGANCSPTCATNAVATVTFDNLDLALNAGDTVNFTVKADINDTDAGTGFNNGASLQADVNSTNRSAISAENSEGDQLTASEKSGTAIGEAQEFRTQGIALALVGSPTSASSNDTGANNDSGTFTIKFKVTAVGGDVYVSSTVGTNYVYVVDQAGVATTAANSAVITDDSDANVTTGGTYLVQDGTSESFTLTVSHAVNEANDVGLYRTSLTGVKWGIADDTTFENTYSSNMDLFKTNYVNLN